MLLDSFDTCMPMNISFLPKNKYLLQKQKLPDDILLPSMIYNLGKLELSAESICTHGRLRHVPKLFHISRASLFKHVANTYIGMLS